MYSTIAKLFDYFIKKTYCKYVNKTQTMAFKLINPLYLKKSRIFNKKSLNVKRKGYT